MDIKQIKNLPPEKLEELKRKLILRPIKSKEELQAWIYLFFDIMFPMGTVYPTSTHGPVDAMWRIYELMKTGDNSEIPQVTMLASRDSYKSLCASAMLVLMMVHFRLQLATAGAIKSQSDKMIQYTTSHFRKLQPYLEYHGWKKISESKSRIDWTDENDGLCFLRVVVATVQGMNSEHCPILCVGSNCKIRTDKGAIRASVVYKKLKAGEKINFLTYNHHSEKTEYKPVSKWWESKKKKMLKIKTAKVSLVVSEDHEVYVKNKGYIKAKDIRKGDVVLRKKGDRGYLKHSHGRRKKIEDIKGKIEKFDNIKLLSKKYTNNVDLLELKCSIHGNFLRKWCKINDRISRKLSPCQKCNSEQAVDKMRISLKDIVKDVKEHGFEFIDIKNKDELTAKNKMTLKCSKGHIFEIIVNNFRYSHSCTKCWCNVSAVQNDMYEYIKTIYDGRIILNDRSVISPLEVDIYMPDLKYGVELDGLYWHCETVKSDIKKRNKDKIKSVRDNNVNVNFFFEDEWRDKKKKEIVKSIIKNRICKSKLLKKRASKLKIIKYQKNKYFKDFFDKNHLNGHAISSFSYALTENDEIISCMSFRKGLSGGDWEISRFSSKVGYSVYGAAGRLIKKFKKDFPNSSLISFSDNRLGEGHLYKVLGFKDITKTFEPSYYYTDFKTRLWRSKCKRINEKNILNKYPTEKDQALGGVFSKKYLGHSRPLHRIYDYGHKKWEKI